MELDFYLNNFKIMGAESKNEKPYYFLYVKIKFDTTRFKKRQLDLTRTKFAILNARKFKNKQFKFEHKHSNVWLFIRLDKHISD